MTVPSNTPTRPGTITAAAVLIWFQVVFLVCCGFLSVFLYIPAFGVTALDLLPAGALSGSALLPILVLALIVGFVWTVQITSRLGEGDRRARRGVDLGLALVLALVLAATLAGGGVGAIIPTAVPSLLCQGIAWICVHSASAERWFRECEQFAVDPEP